MRVQAGAVAAGVILLGLLVDAGGGEDYGIGADQVRTLDLADVVGGGDGTGTGADAGTHMASGQVTAFHRSDDLGPPRNLFSAALTLPFVDGVFVPDGGADGSLAVPVSSTGLRATGLVTPATSDRGTWDDLWNGGSLSPEPGRKWRVRIAELSQARMSRHRLSPSPSRPPPGWASAYSRDWA